jgi:hypothetical protein
VTYVKVAAFVINIALVFYLVWRKRLFGARGGREAFERERHEDSLLEVEASAAAPDRQPVTPATSSSAAE